VTPRLPAGRAPLKKRLPHPPVVTCRLRLRNCALIHLRPTRGLLIRLLELRRNQISESFQVARVGDRLQLLIWVPWGWVYSSAGVSKASFLHPSLAVVVAQHDGAVE
jgi:hypothetical protein